jgi:hypothetical protein
MSKQSFPWGSGGGGISSRRKNPNVEREDPNISGVCRIFRDEISSQATNTQTLNKGEKIAERKS